MIHKTAERIWEIALDSWGLNVELSDKGVITYQSAWEKEFIERIEAELRTFLKNAGLGSIVIPKEEGEICQSCGKGVGCVWSAPSKLWHEVTGLEFSGILCPKCFATCVEECLHTLLYWSCDTRGFPGLVFIGGKVVSTSLGILLQRAKLWLLNLGRKLKNGTHDGVR